MFKSKQAKETNPDKLQMLAGITKATTTAIDGLQSALKSPKGESETEECTKVL